VTPTVVGSWNGGFQADVAVRNNGTLPTSGWTVRFSFAGPQTIASSWNAVLTQTGQQVVAANAGYNGSIPANGSTSFGMVVNGANQPLTGISCTTR